MMDNNVRHIIEAELLAGEELLWAHIVEPPVVSEARPSNKVMKWIGAFFQVISFSIFVKSLLDQGLSLFNNGTLVAVIIGLAIIGLSLFWRTPRGQALNKSMRRNVFQNGIITQKRLLFFNHYDAHRLNFFAGDIASAAIDFENGGKALRVRPSNNSKDLILVGGVSFEPAIALIRKTFLIKGPLS